jgi:superfamily I DNA/RNA helicase
VVIEKEKADIIFSTIHRSKGQTYNIPVYISNDHFDLENTYIKKFIDKDNEVNINNLYEEMCIVYVAITRCAREIELSENIKNYLSVRYENNGHDIKHN